ncbi:VCBS domain-containing protein [Caulobacter sp. NIBR1757]|uniref:VCBS domain-containing protein n=1 Tax=Caulobacter sp. NIBR1757 TaxID=3016000 RepID=UPI0022F0C099|nr:VCBS domain-containing protein [Caulobacter sp. NIBR1757]WGM40072.1 hypothetical protein AMEJIAPC_03013 [Caulobacter sp. NIBR1757]
MPNQRTETVVNTTTAGSQNYPTVATLPDGGYVIAWISSGQAGDANGGIWFQRYNAAGQKVSADGATLGAQEVLVNSTTDGRQYYPDITVLPDGKFVFVWVSMDGQDGSGEGVYSRLFGADGAAIGAEVLVPVTTAGRQADPQVTALGTGYVISWASNAGPGDASTYRVYAQRFDGAGNFVGWDGAANGNSRTETLINTSTANEQGWNNQLALADGKLLMLYGSRHLDGSVDIFGKLYNADGTVAAGEFRISQYAPSEQIWPAATQLEDGRIVVTWSSYGQDGSGYGVYARVLTAAGVPAGDEFRASTTAGGDQSNGPVREGSQVQALSDGGFLVVWHAADNNGAAVFYQRFDAEGDKVGGEVLANTGNFIGDQYVPSIRAFEGGFQLVWHSTTGDGDGWTVYQKTYALEEAIVRAGGEDQVNTATGFNQRLPQVASAADGSYVIVWQSQTTYNSGDGSGWGLFAQRYNADGTRAGAEFQVNTTTAGDQPYDSGWQVTQLVGGKFLVVWGTTGQSGDGDLVSIGQLFNADGSKAGGEFRLNETTAGEQIYPAVTALADGGFVAVYRGYFMNGGSSYDVFFQRFDAAGAKVGPETRVSVADSVNTSDGSEHQGRVLGLADGGFIVMFADSGNDGSGEGLYARRYDVTGALVGGTNADGSAASASWQVNLQTLHDQYMKYGCMAALADGGFVLTFSSNHSDQSGLAVWAQVYNADGTLRSPQLRVNGGQWSTQADPAVAALADGSFVLVWMSEQPDASHGQDIYAKRFAADGSVLNEEFLVDTVHDLGNQRWPSVAATADGFIVTWEHETSEYGQTYDGSGGSIWSQRFTVDGLNASADTAHRPILVAADVHGGEDSAIALDVTAALSGAALGTESLSIGVAGIPVGATLSDGDGHSFTASAAQTSVDVTGWRLSGLTITPAPDSEADFTLRIRATSTDSASGDSVTNEDQVFVTVDARADAMDIGGRSERVNSYTTGDQVFDIGGDQVSRSPVASWADGSYVVVWQSRDQDGAEWGVFGQRYAADGSAIGTEFQVNSYTPSVQMEASVVALAGGGFVVTWSSFGQITPAGGGDPYYSYQSVFSRVYDAGGNPGAETLVNSFNGYATYQMHSDITALSDGGYLIAWHSDGQDGSSYGTYAQRYNAAGQAVSRDGAGVGADEFRLNTTTANEQSWPSITGLPGGGFIAVWNSNGQAGGSAHDVVIRRFDSAGQPVGAEAVVNQTLAGNQFHPNVTVLSDGGYLIVWQSDNNDGSSWAVMGRVYNADGSARSDEFLANRVTAGDQSKAQAVALSDGGFFIAWHGQGEDMYGYGVFGQRFDSEGDSVGGEFPLDASRTYGEQTFPFLAAGADGSVIAVWQGHDPQADGYWGDGSGWGIFGTRFQLDANPAAPTGGESQVNSKSAHDQSGADIATLTDGSYIVVWRSAPSRGTGDISSNGVFAQRYGADGQPIGSEFTVNTTLTGDQTNPQVAALAGGGYVVTWQSSQGDGAGYGIFAQRFDSAGNATGGEFQVNSGAAGNQYDAQITALTGPNAGGFVITWHQDNGEVEARVFDAAGNPVGADLQVNLQIPRLNGSDAGEYLPAVAATADGGFVIVWRDNDTDGYGTAVFGQRYGLSGGVVTRLGGMQPDGSAATDNFRVNDQTYGNQSDPRVVGLAGGGFLVVFQSDVADSNGAGLVGQIYNAAGGRVGGEFVMTSHVAGTQVLPDLVAMPDGGVLMTWQSDHNDGFDGVDVFVKRFAADGRVLGEEQRVNSYGAGYQGDPAISVVGDGFTVVWTSTGQDGSGNGVFQQHFTFDTGPNGAVADRPTLSAGDTTGDEDTAIALTVSAGLADTDGSETLTLEVSDIPVGATLSDGTHSFTATAADRTVDIAGWTLSSLTITPPADSDADFTLTLRAQSRETVGGDVAWNTDSIRVTVNAVAEVQLPFNDEFDVNTTANGSQYDPQVTAFADGSFVVIWTSDSNAGGAAEDIIGRLFNADGTPAGAEFIVNTYTGYYENRPDVTVLANGDFLVSWTQQDESGWGVFGQRFDADGVKLALDGAGPGTAVRINDTTARDQYWPEVTALADGGWIVTWQSFDQEAAPGQPGDETWGIYAKRYAADGSVVQMYDAAGVASSEVRINVTVAGSQQHGAVVQLAGGGFAFSWYGPDASGGGQYIRFYDASGHPVTSLGTDGEMLVNTTTTSEQGAEGGAMAALTDGGVVVTWHSLNQDGSGYGVYGQVYNADGTTRGGEFHVSAYAYDSQQEPRVTSLPDGGFMVAWTSANQDGDSWGVYAQRFDATGDAVGAEFRLNETTAGDQSTPAIAVQPDGSGVIVVWEAPDGSGGGIDAKLIPLPDAATELAIDTAGVEQQVNSYTTADQLYPSVTKLDDGSYVVVWQSNGQDGSSWGVYAKHFDSDGDAIQLTDSNGDPLWVLDGNGDPVLVPDGQGNQVQVPLTEFRVNSYANSEQRTANVVATADGGFLVVFQSYGNTGAGDGDWGVYARKYDAQMQVQSLLDAGGNPVAELRLNSYTNSTQEAVKAALLEDGSVVVTWQSDGLDGSTWGIASRRIDAAGQLVGVSDTVVNTTTTDQQLSPAIAALTDGDYVITWSAYNHDGSEWGVYAQRFNADGTRDGQEMLVNTLTDSAQIYPSVAGLSDGGYVIAWQTYTGADADNSGYGIAGQRYDAAGNAVGGEFLINGVGYQDQSQVTLVAAPDGGFVVAWTSYQADGSSNGVVARRFDAAGNATEPYGDDVLVNTYSLGDQSGPAIAMLDRGFVAVWHSQGQDGSGYAIEMQRFQGQGLEPPPLIVDAAHGGDSAGDLIFSTLQEALDAAEDGDTVILKGGTYNLSTTAVVDVDDLRIKNAVGETVIINGPAGAAALEVGAGLNITLRGDAVERLVFNAGAGADAAVDFLGTNSGTEILRVTINANGDYGLRFGGGQNGVSISDSTFGGAAAVALVLVRGTASGVAASTGVNVLDSLFSGTGGSGLVTEATGGQILENVFSGDFAEGFAALVAWAAGGDIQDNSFSGPGAGAWFYDLANAYAEATFIGQNAFPAGWAWVQERGGVFSTLKEALATAQAGDTIQATAGDYAGESGLTVADDDLKINAPAGATGIVLALGPGVTTVTFNDAAAIDVTGNGAANIVHGGSGADSVHGAAGDDQLNGRDGNDQLFGDAGADVLTGGSGDDAMQGGADSDRYVVSLGEGHDTVTDVSGADDVLALYTTNFGGNDGLVLSGAAGSTTATFNGDATANVTATGIERVEVTLDNNDGVTLTGAVGAASVRISGGTGANVIDASGLTSATAVTFTGGRGADSFTGSAGLNDTIDYAAEADPGAVTINLAAGTAIDTNGDTDTLSGVENVITGAGADSITGSSVANRIEAGGGNDSVAGGGGIDSFVFRAGFGTDTISDFAPATEFLRFDAAVFATVADVLAAASASGGNTVISAGANSITLTGVTPAQLGAWNIDILGSNDAPTLRAGAPSATLREVGQGVAGTAVSTVALTAADVDGTVAYDAAALTADGWVQGPAGVWTKDGVYGQAVLTIASNSLAYALDNARTATQALQTGQTVTETFTVPVVDDGSLTATRAVTFSIGGSNDAPVGVVDTGTAVEAGVAPGANATGNVLTNDIDVDAGDSKVVSAINGGAVGSALAGAYGSLTLNADGTYSYAIDNANSTVQALRTAAQTLTDSFTYTVRDAAGATSSTTLTITLQGANDAPVAVADTGIAGEAGVAAGSDATGNVLTNDTDVDTGDSKTVSAVTGGTVGSALNGTYGTLTLNADGSYAYAVNNANAAVNALRTTANTLTDSFTYTVADASGATSSTTLTITVRGTNDAPVAVADSGTAVEAGTSAGSAASGNLLTNDTDVDTGDTKAVTAFSQGASNGTIGSGLAGAYGTLTVNANGTWTYVVNDSNATVQALRLAGETLTETFNYTLRDTAGATSASTLTVTIQGANDAPVGVNDAGSANEAGVAAGSNATGNVLTNDTDVDAGDSKTVSALSGGTVGSALNGTYGALTLNADGSYSYAVNNANAAVNALRLSTDTLTDSFTYTVRDTAGATSTATLTITVHGANDAPVGVGDSGTAVEAGTAAGSNVSGNVLANDTDVDTGDATTVSAVTGGAVGASLAGAYGALTLNADGSYSYVVDNANAAVNALRLSTDTLTDVFTYTVRDTAGATSTASLTITVQGANDAPVAEDDTGSASLGVDGGPSNDATGNVLSNDTDVDSGDGKTVTALSGGTVGAALAGQYGTLTLNADGSYTYVIDELDPAVVALGPTDSISETFTYTLADAAGATDTAVLTITVFGANESPTAVADVGAAVEAGVAAGSNASGNVLTNDTDPDAGDSKTVTQVKFGAATGALGSALAGDYGSLTLNADGSYSYAIDNSDAVVQALRTASDTLTEVFTYTMRDTAGATSTTTLTITIQGANDAPVAVADVGTAVEAGVVAGSNATGNVLTNDTDVDAGDGKTVTALTGGTVGSALAGTYGSLTLNTDGSYSYAVNNANSAVQALRTAGQTLSEAFTYTVTDTAGATSSTTLTITIQGANDAPVAVADIGSATEAGTAAGSNATGNVLTNDTDVDGGDGKSVSAVSGGIVGSALAGQYGSLTLNADGSYSYAIDNAHAAVNALRLSTDTLTDSFTYTVTDTAGATSSTTLTITVHGANDAPVAVADTGTAVEAGTAAGSNATGNVLTNDTDVDTGDSKTVTALTGGTVGSALAGAYGSLTLNADGTYSYAVNNASSAVQALRTSAQTLTESFTYTVTDAAGATSATTLTITIQGANDAPVAVADTGSATEAGTSAGSNASGNVLTNDTDVDGGDGKTVSALSGGVVGSASAGAYGALTLNANGTYSYAVDNGNAAVNALAAGQTLTDVFTYTVADTAGATSQATLTITVNGANDAPVAVADTGSATEAGTAPGSNATGNVLANDTDVDSGDALTVAALDGGTLGAALNGDFGALTLNADGSYSYVVNEAAVNSLRTFADTVSDTFTYTVRDAAGATSTASLTITTHGANDAPVAVDDAGAASKDGDGVPIDAVGNVLTNDTDVDSGDSKTVSAITGGTVGAGLIGQHGTLTLNADGSYRYVTDESDPAVLALGPTDSLTETFTYTLTDTAGATDTAVLTITVYGANEAPVAVADVATAVEAGVAAGTDPSGNVLTNDTDEDAGDTQEVTQVQFGATVGTLGSALAGAYGSLTLNADGSYAYVVDNGNATVNALRTAGETLTETFTYTMRDAVGVTSTTTLTITLQGANDAPVAGDDLGDATDGGPNGSGNVLTNDSDVDGGDARTVSAVTGGAVGSAFAGQYGTLTLNANGTWSYVVNGANAAVAALGASQTLTDSFTYTVRDTAGAIDTASLDITVHGINDAPVLDLQASRGGTGTVVGFGDSTGAVSIIPADVLIDDPDDTVLTSATLRLTNPSSGDRLAIGNLPALAALGITASAYDSGTGILTLTGPASESAFQQALHLVTFNSTNPSPPLGDRLIQVTVTDGLATSNIAVATVQVVARMTLYGTAGADNLTGNVGGDTLLGRAGDDLLKGMGGNDQLNGEAGIDRLYGGDGNDRLVGGDDADSLYGEAGDDNLSGDAGDDRLNGGDGDDSLAGGAGKDILTAGAGNDTLRGDDDDDTLNGEAGADRLYGGAGADRLNGGIDGDFLYGDAGDDTLTGFDGDDTLTGGAGADKIYGNLGADRAYGGDDNDQILGDAGGDTLNGDGGDDKIYGGDDNDVLNGGIGNDFLRGDAGDDKLTGADGDDDLAGGDGADILNGGLGIDLLKGDAGDDQLSGDAGADRLYGGDGTDRIYGGDDADQAWGDAGADTLLGQAGDDTLWGGAGLDSLYGGDGVDQIHGGDDADTVSGDAGNDSLWGDAGDDRMLGGDGDDVLIGGIGLDTMTGGSGSDRFVFSTITDSAPGGADRITDFNGALDTVDLSAIDANTGLGGNQAFTWAAAFTGVAGQAVLTYSSVTKVTTLTLDNNGDGVSDFALTFTGQVTGGSGFIL